MTDAYFLVAQQKYVIFATVYNEQMYKISTFSQILINYTNYQYTTNEQGKKT